MPFVVDSGDGNLDCWHVVSQGDIEADVAMGVAMARAWLSYAAARQGDLPSDLNYIVNAMIGHGSRYAAAIRAGFLGEISQFIARATRSS